MREREARRGRDRWMRKREGCEKERDQMATTMVQRGKYEMVLYRQTFVSWGEQGEVQNVKRSKFKLGSASDAKRTEVSFGHKRRIN